MGTQIRGPRPGHMRRWSSGVSHCCRRRHEFVHSQTAQASPFTRCGGQVQDGRSSTMQVPMPRYAFSVPLLQESHRQCQEVLPRRICAHQPNSPAVCHDVPWGPGLRGPRPGHMRRWSSGVSHRRRQEFVNSQTVQASPFRKVQWPGAGQQKFYHAGANAEMCIRCTIASRVTQTVPRGAAKTHLRPQTHLACCLP